MTDLQFFCYAFGFIAALALLFLIIYIAVLVNADNKLRAVRMGRIFCSVICTLIAILAFFANFGWIRFMLFFLLVPLWYPAVLILYSVLITRRSVGSWLTRVCFIFNHLLFLAAPMLLPDGGDYGPQYVFFGQILDTGATFLGMDAFSLCYNAALHCFVLSLVLMFVHIFVLERRYRREYYQSLGVEPPTAQ